MVASKPFINNTISESVNGCMQSTLPWSYCDHNLYCNASEYMFRTKTFYFENEDTDLKVSFDETWALDCNGPIYDDRNHMILHQEGIGVVNDNCGINLTVTSGCEASWTTTEGMCNACSDACDSCDGSYLGTCLDYDSEVPFEDTCPMVCDVFELTARTMYTITFVDNCSAMIVVESRSLLDTEIYYVNSAETELGGMILILLVQIWFYILMV